MSGRQALGQVGAVVHGGVALGRWDWGPEGWGVQRSRVLSRGSSGEGCRWDGGDRAPCLRCWPCLKFQWLRTSEPFSFHERVPNRGAQLPEGQRGPVLPTLWRQVGWWLFSDPSSEFGPGLSWLGLDRQALAAHSMVGGRERSVPRVSGTSRRNTCLVTRCGGSSLARLCGTRWVSCGVPHL